MLVQYWQYRIHQQQLCLGRDAVAVVPLTGLHVCISTFEHINLPLVF